MLKGMWKTSFQLSTASLLPHQEKQSRDYQLPWQTHQPTPLLIMQRTEISCHTILCGGGAKRGRIFAQVIRRAKNCVLLEKALTKFLLNWALHAGGKPSVRHVVALIIRFQFDSLIRKRRVSVGLAEFMMNHILQQTSFSYFNYTHF